VTGVSHEVGTTTKKLCLLQSTGTRRQPLDFGNFMGQKHFIRTILTLGESPVVAGQPNQRQAFQSLHRGGQRTFIRDLFLTHGDLHAVAGILLHATAWGLRWTSDTPVIRPFVKHTLAPLSSGNDDHEQRHMHPRKRQGPLAAGAQWYLSYQAQLRNPFRHKLHKEACACLSQNGLSQNGYGSIIIYIYIYIYICVLFLCLLYSPVQITANPPICSHINRIMIASYAIRAAKGSNRRREVGTDSSLALFPESPWTQGGPWGPIVPIGAQGL